MRIKIVTLAFLLLLAAQAQCFAESNSSTPTPFDSSTGYAAGPAANGSTISLASQPKIGSTYYTIDGSTPDTTKTLYTAPFSLPSNATTTIKSITYAPNGLQNGTITSSVFWSPLQFLPNASGSSQQDLLDTSGNKIQAHGGGIVWDPDNNYYVWIGQNMNALTSTVSFGPNIEVQPPMMAYTSTNLYNWTPVGQVVPSIPNTAAYKNGSNAYNVVERCHMFRNSSPTNPLKKWVGWCHLDSDPDFYHFGSAGVFTGPTSTGPFTWASAPVQDPTGSLIHDDNVFVDPNNGNKYLVYTHSSVSGGSNDGIFYTQLDSATDYTSFTGSPVQCGASSREGVTMFYNNGYYFLISSVTQGYTSVASSAPAYRSATTLAGLNAATDNLLYTSPASSGTVAYTSQTTSVFNINGYTAAWVVMLDNWAPGGSDLNNAKYVFWPMTFPTASTLQTTTPDTWDIVGTYGTPH